MPSILASLLWHRTSITGVIRKLASQHAPIGSCPTALAILGYPTHGSKLKAVAPILWASSALRFARLRKNQDRKKDWLIPVEGDPEQWLQLVFWQHEGGVLDTQNDLVSKIEHLGGQISLRDDSLPIQPLGDNLSIPLGWKTNVQDVLSRFEMLEGVRKTCKSYIVSCVSVQPFAE